MAVRSSTRVKKEPSRLTVTAEPKAATKKEPSRPTVKADPKAAAKKEPSRPTVKAESKATTKKEPSRPKVKTDSKATTKKEPSRPKVKAESKAATKKEPSRPTTQAEPKAQPAASQGKQPAAAAAKKRSAPAASAAPNKRARTEEDDEDVLLGHLISKCVGIQHYTHNGVRVNKEPLRLMREPHNPYDRNAIGVYTIDTLRQIGHVPRVDALVIARVADGLPVKMVGQIERGADQVYKFPIRICFFGPSGLRDKVKKVLETGGCGLVLPEPPRAPRVRAQPPARPSQRNAAGPSAAGAAGAGSSAAPADDESDEVEFAGIKTWAERDAELRAQAVVLE